MKFYIVDAFAEQLFGGNPAGVVILKEGEEFPADEIMRKTAAELRYSETAFIRPLGDREFQIRYFTPAAEVDLCGHATIGSFAALQAHGMVKAGDRCINRTLAGDLSIQAEDGFVMMEMGAPQTIEALETEEKREELYRIMGLSHAGQEAAGKGLSLLPKCVSTGLPDIMMPVADMEQLQKIKPDFEALSKLSEQYGVTGVHAFTLCGDGTVHTRNFAPLYDIDEEAATGTSTGALTYYLYEYGLLESGKETLFIQGEAMDRPSKIRSTLTAGEDGIQIMVGGSAKVLAEGEIYI